MKKCRLFNGQANVDNYIYAEAGVGTRMVKRKRHVCLFGWDLVRRPWSSTQYKRLRNSVQREGATGALPQNQYGCGVDNPTVLLLHVYIKYKN